ncbi:hypothetical protein GFPCMMHI_04402 [Ensifer adhaerens]|nr:hypothetical protein [Ensifer adhaerens]
MVKINDSHATHTGHICRLATSADFSELTILERSAFTRIGSRFYPLADVEIALDTLQGLTLSLIQEGHYFVLVNKENAILASGGWSRAVPDYRSHYSDPNPDKPMLENLATVRCVYVHPDHERRGYAKKIMQRIEKDARNHNVSGLALSSSRTALALYRSLDYIGGAVHMVNLPNGRGIELHEMYKTLLTSNEFPALEEQRTKNECSSN